MEPSRPEIQLPTATVWNRTCMAHPFRDFAKAALHCLSCAGVPTPRGLPLPGLRRLPRSSECNAFSLGVPTRRCSGRMHRFRSPSFSHKCMTYSPESRRSMPCNFSITSREYRNGFDSTCQHSRASSNKNPRSTTVILSHGISLQRAPVIRGSSAGYSPLSRCACRRCCPSPPAVENSRPQSWHTSKISTRQILPNISV